MDTAKAEMHPAIPILRVHDLAASLTYYTERLGFHLNWNAGGFCSVSRDHCTLFLCEGGQGHAGTWSWTAVANADELHADFVAKGATILTPPTNYPWGSRELHVVDPDGHVLRFASDATGDDYGAFPPDRTEA